MQKLYIFITVALLFAGFSAMAQPGTPAVFIGDYSKMSSRGDMDRDMANSDWPYRVQHLKSGKYSFLVTMKNRSVVNVRSKIYADSAKNQSYLIDANNLKIYCNQTVSIIRDNGDQKLEGLAYNGYWLFNVIKGKISAYSFLSETSGLNSFYLWQLQIDGGGLQQFDPQLLEPLVKNDTKAYKAFLKKDYYKAILLYNASR